MTERGTIRDFIYLDWERTRSIAAQLFRGIPVDTSRETGSEAATGAAIEGGIISLLRGRVSGDYRFFRSESETHSLHHHVYTMVEERLASDGLLLSVDGNFDFERWSRASFRDGRFVRVSGLVRLIDYEWVLSMMDAFPKLMRGVQHASMLELKKLVDTGTVTQKEVDAKRREQEKEFSGLKDLKIEQLTEIVRKLYGEVVRIKLLPSKEHADKLFVGTAPIGNFYDNAASLSQKYGYEIDAGWITLGQVNMPAGSDTPQSMPTGNQMEDSLEQVALSLSALMRVASSVQFPAVSFTPISIYRAEI